MREIRPAIVDRDDLLEEAVRAKQQLDAERWRHEGRPRELRRFAAAAAKLRWSRAFLTVVVEELYPDALFTELVGDLHRVPARRWPRVLALAVALRRSWRRDGIAQLARLLHVRLATKDDLSSHRPKSHPHPSRPSRRLLSGSPQPRQGSPRRSDPSRGSGLDKALGRAATPPLRDGRESLTSTTHRRRTHA